MLELMDTQAGVDALDRTKKEVAYENMGPKLGYNNNGLAGVYVGTAAVMSREGLQRVGGLLCHSV